MFKTGSKRLLAAVCLFCLSALYVSAQSGEFAITNEAPAVVATTNASETTPTEPAESHVAEPPDHGPVAISVEAGTTGIGANAIFRFADHLGVRGGADYFAYSYT